MADNKTSGAAPAKRTSSSRAAKADEASTAATTEDKAAAVAATTPGEPGDDLNKAAPLDKGDVQAVQAALEAAQPEGSQGPTPAEERRNALRAVDEAREKGAPPAIPPFLSEGVRQDLETFGEAVDPGTGGMFKVENGHLTFTPRQGDKVVVDIRAPRK